MKQVSSVADLTTARNQCTGKVAFVSTMGNLHAGHVSLVRLAKEHADRVIVSIFVNPLQFSAGEDLDSYPRTLAEDLDKLRPEGVDIVFTPREADLYPRGRAKQTQVNVPELSSQLCGATRPNFFGGIATVVTKLLCLVRPDVAVFGQKDYQQWLVISRLVQDLHLDVQLIRAPIVREDDGLAMSSRNGYLSAQERALAPRLYQSLADIKSQIEQGGANIDHVLHTAREQLAQYFNVDYLVCRSATDLSEASSQAGDPLIVLVAAMLGRTRLIDNVLIHSA